LCLGRKEEEKLRKLSGETNINKNNQQQKNDDVEICFELNVKVTKDNMSL
jgi:hypothetical protein